MSQIEAALTYLSKGWSVFPVHVWQENGKWKKRPLVDWKSLQTERPSIDQVKEWFTLHSDAAIGLALGRVSGLIRIDVEGPVPSDKYPIPAGGIEFTTISGGKGYLFGYMDGASTKVVWRGSGDHQELRVQSAGAYTVVPPFQGYTWVCEGPVTRMPDWLYNLYIEDMLRDTTKELRPTLREPEREDVLEALKHIPADDYDMWIQVGMALKSAGEEYFEVWDAWSRTSAKYALNNGMYDVRKKWDGFHGGIDGVTTRSLYYWAEQYDGWKPPNRHEPLTDRGNANMLVRAGLGRIHHSSVWGWVSWDGKKWQKGGDAEKIVQEMQKGVIQSRIDETVKSIARLLKKDDDEIKGKHKQKLNTLRRIHSLDQEVHYRGARALASSDPSVTIDHKVFDASPMLFNCVNGTLDLRTSELRDHCVDDKITVLCNTPYDPTAKAPLWEKFLIDVIPDDDVRTFVQQFLGCCLTGDTTAQIMPVFWGSGANGKSTMIQVLFHVLGDDYSMKAKRDLLIASRQSSHPTSIARLCGKRFVACVETDEFGRFDEPLLKELTGNDSIAARFMRQDEWEFIPTHKLILATNHKPEVRGTDDAIWRRIPLVPFTQQFKGDRCDPDLKDKLLLEAPGILAWMVRGCEQWLANNKKLVMPNAVQAATKEYRFEQDKIALFIEDMCETGEGFECHSGKLMETYTSWCLANRHPPMNGQKFGRVMTEKGFPLARSKYRTGIKLK